MVWTTLARLGKHGAAERVTHVVYQLHGTPADEHHAMQAAWLQLAQDTTLGILPSNRVWSVAGQGAVCRWSAAAVYGLQRQPARIHYFTLPGWRQTRQADVELYPAVLSDRDRARVNGLLVTRPARIVANLLEDGEDLAIVAQLIADVLREAKDTPQEVAAVIASHAAWFGFAEHDGLAMLNWLFRQAPQVQHRLRLPFDLDSALSEAAIGGPYLLVRSGRLPGQRSTHDDPPDFGCANRPVTTGHSATTTNSIELMLAMMTLTRTCGVGN